MNCDCAECNDCDVFVEGTFLLWLCDWSRMFTLVIQQPFVYRWWAKIRTWKEEEGFLLKMTFRHQFLYDFVCDSKRDKNLFRFFLFLGSNRDLHSFNISFSSFLPPLDASSLYKLDSFCTFPALIAMRKFRRLLMTSNLPWAQNHVFIIFIFVFLLIERKKILKKLKQKMKRIQKLWNIEMLQSFHRLLWKINIHSFCVVSLRYVTKSIEKVYCAATQSRVKYLLWTLLWSKRVENENICKRQHHLELVEKLFQVSSIKGKL